MANQINPIRSDGLSEEKWRTVLQSVAKMAYGHGVSIATEEGRAGGKGFIGLLAGTGPDRAGFFRVVKFGTRHILPSCLSNEATEEAVLACNNLKRLLNQALDFVQRRSRGPSAPGDLSQLRQSLKPVPMDRDSYTNADLLSRKIVAAVLNRCAAAFGGANHIWDGCESESYGTAGWGRNYREVAEGDEFASDAQNRNNLGNDAQHYRYSTVFKSDSAGGEAWDYHAPLADLFKGFIPFDTASPKLSDEHLQAELVRHARCTPEFAKTVFDTVAKCNEGEPEMPPPSENGGFQALQVALLLRMAMRNRDVRTKGYDVGDLRAAWQLAVWHHLKKSKASPKEPLDAYDLLYGIAKVAKLRDELSTELDWLRIGQNQTQTPETAARVLTAIGRMVDDEREDSPTQLSSAAIRQRYPQFLPLRVNDNLNLGLGGILWAFVHLSHCDDNRQKTSRLIAASGGGLRHMDNWVLNFSFEVNDTNGGTRKYISKFHTAGNRAETESDVPPVTNLAYSQLVRDDTTKTPLVGFVRYGRMGMLQSPLNQRDSVNGQVNTIFNFMNTRRESAEWKSESQPQGGGTLYRIDLISGNRARITRDNLDAANRGRVKCFRLPIDSRQSEAWISSKDYTEIRDALRDLLPRAEEKMKAKAGSEKEKEENRKLRALVDAIRQQEWDDLFTETDNKQYSCIGKGAALCYFGALLANLIWLLGDIPAVNCNQGRDRTGIMDGMIKAVAIMLDKGETPTREPKDLSLDNLLQLTGNQQVAKLCTIANYTINKNQSHGDSHLTDLFPPRGAHNEKL